MAPMVAAGRKAAAGRIRTNFSRRPVETGHYCTEGNEIELCSLTSHITVAARSPIVLPLRRCGGLVS
jgi:hypothetical protein